MDDPARQLPPAEGALPTSPDYRFEPDLDRLGAAADLLANPSMGFYNTPSWLAATSDTEAAESGYLAVTTDNGQTGVAPLSYPDSESNNAYRPHWMFPYRSDRPYALLGPRRGYRTDLAVGGPEAAGALLRAAAELGARNDRRWLYALHLTTRAANAIASSGVSMPVLSPMFDCVVPVSSSSMDDHLSSLNKHQRRRIRQDREIAAATGLVFGLERLADNLDEVLALRLDSFRRHGSNVRDTDLRLELERLSEHAAEHEVFITARARTGRRLCGYSLSYDWGGYLWGRSLGLVEELRGADTRVLFELELYRDLDVCFARGLRGVYLGPSGYHAKILRGARLEPLWQASLHDGAEVFPADGVVRWTDHVLDKIRAECGQVSVALDPIRAQALGYARAFFGDDRAERTLDQAARQRPQRRVLLVGGGSQLQTAFREVNPDTRTNVLCRTSTLPTVASLADHDSVIVLNDAASTADWLTAAELLDKAWPIDLVTSLTEVDQDRAAAIATRLGKSFHKPATITCVNDKSAMRTRLRERGIEDVPHRLVRSEAELLAFVREAGLPVVVKPNSGRGSAGIAVVRDEAEVAQAFQMVATEFVPMVGMMTPLAERYLTGQLYTVEAITDGGEHYVVAVTETTLDPRTKVVLGNLVPARLPDDTVDLIVAHTKRALTALEISTGITHTELMLGADGPALIETHLRPSGGGLLNLVYEATGVDLVDLWLRQIGGTDISDTHELRYAGNRPRYRCAAMNQFLTAPPVGEFDGVDGWDSVADADGVIAQDLTAAIGSPLSKLHNQLATVGWVRVVADNPDTARSLAQAAAQPLRVRTTN